MVNKCANPECVRQLHYLRDGKIYLFSLKELSGDGVKPAGLKSRMEHFWLCGACSELFLLKAENMGSVELVPRSRRVERMAPLIPETMVS